MDTEARRALALRLMEQLINELPSGAAISDRRRSRGYLLAQIAEMQAKAGAPEAAEQNFQEALRIADSIEAEAGVQWGIRSHVAAARIRLGDRAEAFRVLEGIQKKELVPYALAVIVEAQVARAEFEQALETMRQIDNDELRTIYLDYIEQCRIGKKPDPNPFAMRYAERVGDIEKAFTDLPRIEDPQKRITQQIDIGKAQMETGDAVGAVRTFRQALAATEISTRERERVLLALAQAQQQAGNTTMAREMLAQYVQELQTRASLPWPTTYRSIAYVQCELGDILGAISTAQLITDYGDKAEMLLYSTQVLLSDKTAVS